jgi:hypothetical protein
MSNVHTGVQPTLSVDVKPAAVVIGDSDPLDNVTPASADVVINAGDTWLLDFITVHCAGLAAAAAITVTVSYKYPALGALFTTVIATTTGVTSGTGTFDFYLPLDDRRLGEGLLPADSILNVTVTTGSATTGTANMAFGFFGPLAT